MVKREALKQRLLDEWERLSREIAELDADFSESLEDSSEESSYDQRVVETAAATLDREKPIGATRLKIMPFAALCADCKRLEERSF